MSVPVRSGSWGGGEGGEYYPSFDSSSLLSYLPDSLQGRVVDAYSFEVDFLGVTGPGTGTLTFTIPQEAHFALLYLTSTVFTTATPPVNVDPAPVTLQIINASSSRQLSNAPLQLNNYTGSAKLPFPYPVPKLVSASSQLTFNIASQFNANLNIYIAVHGFKIFSTYRDGRPATPLPALY